MANQTPGLIGRKLGMTQVFDEEGAVQPVTVIIIPTNHVVAVKREGGADGYSALQIGIDDRKAARTPKPEAGHFAKAGVVPCKHLREIRVKDEVAARYKQGQAVAIEDFVSAGAKVDVTGISKGRGFAGVFKKFNFKGFISTHGTHEFFRHGGSIGTRLTPGMVFKGKKMPGQYGNSQVTIQNQRVVKVDSERGLIYLRGGVPGPNGGYMVIRQAVKG